MKAFLFFLALVVGSAQGVRLNYSRVFHPGEELHSGAVTVKLGTAEVDYTSLAITTSDPAIDHAVIELHYIAKVAQGSEEVLLHKTITHEFSGGAPTEVLPVPINKIRMIRIKALKKQTSEDFK